ncbi:MAG: ATP-binding cassette domain-containing protein [Tannerella sp.]|jgi:molybdate transport system ATP-binding protein|nr:ATP-binding cassette domain-containing protein [Tannerella sp.]
MNREHIAFAGPNGGGKSLLARSLFAGFPQSERRITCDFLPLMDYREVKMIAFRDVYGAADNSYYLQQRWNSQDMQLDNLQLPIDSEAAALLELFGAEDILDKPAVMLSSGERRKFQLIKALLAHPRYLVIDNPFIGLDAASRTVLTDLLSQMAAMDQVGIILLLARAEEIPDFITHAAWVEGMTCGTKTPRQEFRPPTFVKPVTGDLTPPKPVVGNDFYASKGTVQNPATDNVIDIRDLSIKYGERVILNRINWTVRRGERWALLGENGSGKSTLLSLVCADNPQSYACDISLFGLRRGSGESIWDIKKRIGYISPEMHRAYNENIPAVKIVASGLYDSVGLYISPHDEQYRVCEWWMNVFGILSLRNRSFLQLSDGEQRLTLLARAFVKDPELLILDEPLHGLDARNRSLVIDLIESFCRRPDKTLIMVTHCEDELPACIDKRFTLARACRR